MKQATKNTEARNLEEATPKSPSALSEPRKGEENVLLTLFQEATAEQVRRAAQEKVRAPRPFTHD